MSSLRATTSLRARAPYVCVLSPAKTMDASARTGDERARDESAVTAPRYLDRARALARALAGTLTPARAREIMDVSDAIARKTCEEFRSFDSAKTKPCAHAFAGPAFKSMNAKAFKTQDDVERLSAHVRVLSGLYGVLRPYDEIAPHRLEMGTKLRTLGSELGASDLYEFWGDAVAEALADDVEELAKTTTNPAPFVVNCASQEYFKSVRTDVLEKRGILVYTMTFPGPSVYAKQARGAMARHCVDAKVASPEDLKTFRGADGAWTFDASASSTFNFVFTRAGVKKPAPGKPKARVNPAQATSAANSSRPAKRVKAR